MGGSVHPLGPFGPSRHAAVKTVSPWTKKKSARKKTTDNKIIIACNDNHLVHHLMTTLVFIPIKKIKWWFLGHSRWVNNGEVEDAGGRRPRRRFLRLPQRHRLLLCILPG